MIQFNSDDLVCTSEEHYRHSAPNSRLHNRYIITDSGMLIIAYIHYSNM